MIAEVQVVVSAEPSRFAEVVAAARAAGLMVEAEHPEIGAFSGTIDEDRLPELRAVDGVEAVELERTLRIPPGETPPG
ncbi:hypothetical protein PJ985_11770 [Streptomyces sp. ACA25]|uniref:hypothetical protein n=1 Tax=Streptomyces sp. ACA25 TaxID=3022596 RepID=UPI0023075FE5|nr:hypothetical protein [Streptomyces sp. ACA25]MDB1088241.1 hypothetical protein [Streptomyces sp. ACA25]